MSEKNLYIDMIEFGKDKINDGVTFDELEAHLKTKKYNIDRHRLSLYFFSTYDSVDAKDRGSSDKMCKPGVRSSLTIESSFRLLEYSELQEARRSSKVAMWTAISAIILSLLFNTTFISFIKGLATCS